MLHSLKKMTTISITKKIGEYEEAYKAWAPQMETHVTTEFLENCTGRIWVIGSWNNSCYEELFENENFNKMSNEYFGTKYQNYSYNITLVERAEK